MLQWFLHKEWSRNNKGNPQYVLIGIYLTTARPWYISYIRIYIRIIFRCTSTDQFIYIYITWLQTALDTIATLNILMIQSGAPVYNSEVGGHISPISLWFMVRHANYYKYIKLTGLLISLWFVVTNIFIIWPTGVYKKRSHNVLGPHIAGQNWDSRKSCCSGLLHPHSAAERQENTLSSVHQLGTWELLLYKVVSPR